MPSIPSHLPVPVARIGGALSTVVSELEHYTHPQYPLAKGYQYALARIVESRPELNSEGPLAQLVDLFSYHQIGSGRDLTRLVDEYGVDAVHDAADFLLETGESNRSHAGGLTWARLENVIEIRQRIRTLDLGINSHDSLHAFTRTIGSLDAACDLSDDELVTAVAIYREEE